MISFPKIHFTNTSEFREAAIFFEQNKCYTKFAQGTIPWKEFWDEQIRRCKHGFTNSAGITITGVHYFYLNFTQIEMKNPDTGRKSMGFPRFIDIDYEYFHILDHARTIKKGIILVKPRRTGFSYKNAAACTHEYIFFKDSRAIIGAFRKDLSENTMKMVLNNVNFLDSNTVWVRPRNPDTREWIRARHQKSIDGVTVWVGFNSEVLTLTFKDNPFASVGKSASIFLFEEGGTFENIKASYGITEPCWKDGEDMIGLPIIFGTGGDMEGGTAEFAEMYYDPKRFNLLEFPNTWDNGKEEQVCGWFIPATRGRFGTYKGQQLIDDDGNSNEELALESILELRERSRSNAASLRNIITQYPLTPQEAFLRSKGSVFPALELSEHLANIETSSILRNAGKPGELYFNQDNQIKFRLNPDLEPIVNFPLKSEDNKHGAIVIYEEPEEGEIPYGLYIAGCDPYDQDKSTTNSLGSFFVYKRFYTANRSYNQIVAEYTGRPESASVFYENCRKLCLYYNAKCLYENQLTGLKGHFQEKHSLHLLYETPTYQLSKMSPNSKVQRGYGIHMNRGNSNSQGIKDQLELYLKEWLLEERDGPNGEKILNLHTILSQPLLKELISYDWEGNFDRVIAFMLCILQSKELHNIHVENLQNQTIDQDPFFQRKLYQKNKKSLY